LEEIRVTFVSYCCVDVIWDTLPVLNKFRIVTPHWWLRRRIKAPKFRTLIEVNLAVSGPYGSRVNVIGDTGETVANFLWIITVHSRINIPPILRTLKQQTVVDE